MDTSFESGFLVGNLNISRKSELGIQKYLDDLDETIEKTLGGGNEECRRWFMVRNNFLPFMLCIAYVIVVKFLGPAFMRNREPFSLRWPMILFNFGLVAFYSTFIVTLITNLLTVSLSTFCEGVPLIKGELPYELIAWCWNVYMIKYVEFLDTLFFVLRKKNRSISFLHVIHHAGVPLIIWVVFKTETNGLFSIILIINSSVHVIMYSYYGLAAIGPHMRKYLWWKKYITILQMVQFVSFLVIVLVVAPYIGCSIVQTNIYIDILVSVLFFSLFLNFYRNTFLKTKRH